MMMSTVMAAQRDTVVAIQICWEQYLHSLHGSHLDLAVSLTTSWLLSPTFSVTFKTDTTIGCSGVSLELFVTSVDIVVLVVTVVVVVMLDIAVVVVIVLVILLMVFIWYRLKIERQTARRLEQGTYFTDHRGKNRASQFLEKRAVKVYVPIDASVDHLPTCSHSKKTTAC